MTEFVSATKAGWFRGIALAVGALAACASPAAAPGADAAADVAVAGTTVLDAEVDGTDSLPDGMGDAPDTVNSTDTPDTADSFDSSDIPYWIAHDIDISGLGTVTNGGVCGMYITVQPNDPPIDPSCTTACPAPYPCTCGTCPWIQTPLMNVPHAGGKAIWTGEEVLVFGGATDGSYLSPMTAERWNPSKNDGFKMIDLPFTVTPAFSPDGPWVQPFWTGKEALVIMDDHEFRFDPKSNVVTEMAIAPIRRSPDAALLWTGDMLFWWGADAKVSAAHVTGWHSDTGWQDLPFPSAFLQPVANTPGCVTLLDAQIYVFDPPHPRNPAAGFDPAKPVMLRYTIATQNWEALPQTMLPDVRCYYANDHILFQSFPDGIAFIPNIGSDVGGPLQTRGEIWWKATGKWTAMAAPPIAPALSSARTWTGKSFLLAVVAFTDPTTGGLFAPAGGFFVKEPTNWPVQYDPYADKYGYATSIGFPKHDRLEMVWAWTGSEVLALGGDGGQGAFTSYYQDGVRLHLPNP